MGKYNLSDIREASQDEAPTSAAPATAQRIRVGVREPGKRSTPGFTRTTVYMRDDTKLKAVRLLQDRKEKRDLSDLIESLVAEWTSKHTDI